jgi:hypothetical protein
MRYLQTKRQQKKARNGIAVTGQGSTGVRQGGRSNTGSYSLLFETIVPYGNAHLLYEVVLSVELPRILLALATSNVFFDLIPPFTLPWRSAGAHH